MTQQEYEILEEDLRNLARAKAQEPKKATEVLVAETKIGPRWPIPDFSGIKDAETLIALIVAPSKK